jgi:hypothetical protein
MSPKVDRLINVSSVIVLLLVPAFSGYMAQARDIQAVKTTEADHYSEIKDSLGRIEMRLVRMEDKLDHKADKP